MRPETSAESPMRMINRMGRTRSRPSPSSRKMRSFHPLPSILFPTLGEQLLRRRRIEVPNVLLKPGKPQWREHLGPAVVILVGVLIVVLVGTAALVSRSSGHADADPAAGAITEPTLDQVPIPLPSPSISVSPAPINSITIEQGGVPDSVDLSDEGTSDWVHWGED